MTNMSGVIEKNDKNGSETILTSSLPENFLLSMRKLFDLLDVKSVGVVPLSKIELQWRDEAVPNLPGVLDTLRKIAPANGMLNFETFVWGLKIALARARNNGPAKTNFGSQSNGMASEVGNSQREYLKSRETVHRNFCPLHGNFKNTECPDRCFAEPSENYKTANEIPSVEGAIKGRSKAEIRHMRSTSGPVSDIEMTLAATRSKGFPVLCANQKFPKYGLATKFHSQPNSFQVTNEEKFFTQQPQIKENLEKIKLDLSAVTATPEPVKTDLELEFVQRPLKPTPVDKRLAAAVAINQSDRLDKLAEALYLNKDRDEKDKMQPINLAGKMIGITGSVQNDKTSSAVTGHFGSLKRPAMSTPYKCLPTELKVRNNNGNQSSMQNHRNKNRLALESRDAAPCKSPNQVITSSKRCLSLYEQFNTTSQAIYSVSKPKKVPEKNLMSDCGRLISEQKQDDCWEINDENFDDSVFTTSPRQLSTPPPARSGRLNHMLNETSTTQDQHLYPHFATLERRNRVDLRKERRRHTVANVISYDMLKSIKLMHDEKKLLLRGIQIFKFGKDMFERSLKDMEHRSNSLPLPEHNSNCGPPSVLSCADLEVLSVKLNEIRELIKEFSLFQVQPYNPIATATSLDGKKTENKLKEENKNLRKKIADQLLKITQLEREKSLIIQQLFHAKGKMQLLQPMANKPSIFI